MRTPSQGWTTFPVAINSPPTSRSMLLGMAKARPRPMPLMSVVHAHDAPVDIEERPAGLPGLMKGVGLDVILVHRFEGVLVRLLRPAPDIDSTDPSEPGMARTRFIAKITTSIGRDRLESSLQRWAAGCASHPARGTRAPIVASFRSHASRICRRHRYMYSGSRAARNAASHRGSILGSFGRVGAATSPARLEPDVRDYIQTDAFINPGIPAGRSSISTGRVMA